MELTSSIIPLVAGFEAHLTSTILIRKLISIEYSLHSSKYLNIYIKVCIVIRKNNLNGEICLYYKLILYYLLARNLILVLVLPVVHARIIKYIIDFNIKDFA